MQKESETDLNSDNIFFIWRKIKMPRFCGLCKKEVEDWVEHVKSEEHQKNLANRQKVL